MTISRRRFIGVAATTAAGIFLSTNLMALNNESPLIRFGLISDVHYADRQPAGSRFYRQSHSKMNTCVEFMNQAKVDFLIDLGDFKDQDEIPLEENTLRYLSKIESAFQKFDGPTYHVLGNHDTDGISKKQFLKRVVNTGIPKTYSYYSFNQNSVHFVVLDGNFTHEGLPYKKGNFSWDDAFIPAQQIGWLKEDLKKNNLPVIVFIHQMLDDSKSTKQAVQNAPEVRKILEEAGNVLCVFQGHVHEERYSLINGIHYYSVNAMVDGDGEENSSYQIVSVSKEGEVAVKGFRKASDREFKSVSE